MSRSMETKAFELICYMVTSACNLLNENSFTVHFAWSMQPNV